MTAVNPGDTPPAQRSWAGVLLDDPKHGPLPALMLLLTVVTGLIDAVSILALGRVFVANMTGNVAFVGFAAAGAAGFSLGASLSALAGFLVGAMVGGKFAVRFGAHRGRLLRNAVGAELGLYLVIIVVTLATTIRPGGISGDTVAAVAAVAMGLQNAAARRLAVPDMTTTVLTMTLTGIAADVQSSGRGATVRRSLAVTSMLLGAAVGAVLVLHVDITTPLAIAAGLLAVVAGGAALASRRPAVWH